MSLDDYIGEVPVFKQLYGIATTVSDTALAKILMESDLLDLSPQVKPLTWKSAFTALTEAGSSTEASAISMALFYYTYSRYITVSEQVSTRMGVKQQNWGGSTSVSEINKYIVYEEEKAKADILMRTVVGELRRLDLISCNLIVPRRVQLIK